MHGSPTTKELKKKHSSRPVGGAETGSWGGEDSQQGNGWRTGAGEVAAGGLGEEAAGGVQSHIHVQINQKEQLKSKTICTTQGCSQGK